MSPLFLHHFTSPIGTILLVTDAAGQLRALDFLNYRERMDKLLARHYGTVSLTDAPIPAALEQALGDYFAGDWTGWPWPPMARISRNPSGMPCAPSPPGRR
jgi:methylated-DNA-[protein]-cysteine S-methyltransferase